MAAKQEKPARVKARTFPINIYSTALDEDGNEIGWILAGQPVNLEHLDAAGYERLTTAYPEGMSAQEAQAKAQAAAAAAAAQFTGE